MHVVRQNSASILLSVHSKKSSQSDVLLEWTDDTVSSHWNVLEDEIFMVIIELLVLESAEVNISGGIISSAWPGRESLQ